MVVKASAIPEAPDTRCVGTGNFSERRNEIQNIADVLATKFLLTFTAGITTVLAGNCDISPTGGPTQQTNHLHIIEDAEFPVTSAVKNETGVLAVLFGDSHQTFHF
jgi:hypothetical protein